VTSPYVEGSFLWWEICPGLSVEDHYESINAFNKLKGYPEVRQDWVFEVPEEKDFTELP
jgi:hypothetical protein